MEKMRFSEEERRLKHKMLEMGVRQTDVAKALGIDLSDVCHVVRGSSRSPRYVAEVYKYLGLKMPEQNKSNGEDGHRV